MKDSNSSQSAKTGLHGHNIYNSCCTLHIDYSKLNTLNVKYNNEKSRDYTNPLLPAGDLSPEHLGLGHGGLLNNAIPFTLSSPTYLPINSSTIQGYQLASGYLL
jgi:hypothetical protein